MPPEGSQEGSHGRDQARRRGGGAADNSALHGRRTRQVAPCARKGGAGSRGGVDSRRVVRHRSHAEPHETMASGLGSCEAGVPSGGVEAAVVGGGDRIGVSEGCVSGDTRVHFRGCRCGSDAGCAVWIGWETGSATCSFRFVSAVHEGSSIPPAGVRHCPRGSAATWTGGAL